MKLIDVNVLIYATDDRSAHHDTARSWLEGALGGSETVGIPTAVAIAFVRLTTNPRIMNTPLEPALAVQTVTDLLALRNVTTPGPTRRHYTVLVELLEVTGVAGNLVTDAHLAALAVEYGAELCSYDSDFGRFPQLQWLVPGST